MYAKNYLPILFNLYTAEEKEGDPDKLPVLETIRVYLFITDSKVSIACDSVSMPQLCVLVTNACCFKFGWKERFPN